MRRQTECKETWHRLLDWDRGQAPSERLASQILISERYEAVDPSHPLGGRDGLKDILCKKDDFKFIAACYFPRGQQSFTEIKNKFNYDLAGVSPNNADGMIFITNQELKLGERDELNSLAADEKKLDLYHLERLNAILNSPPCYGIRLEFLDIEMSKEEQLAFMATKDQQILELSNMLKALISQVNLQGNNASNITMNVLPLPQSEKNNNDGLLTDFPKPLMAMAEKYVGSYNLGEPFHTCSHCNYTFKLFKPNVTTHSLETNHRDRLLTFYHVTCPKCGSIDKV